MKLRAYLLMLFVVAVWGSTFVIVKGALADVSPALFNLLRMALSFALLAVAYHRAWRGLTRTQLISGAIVGLCLAAGYQFQTIGLVRTTPSKSAFITGLVVVLVPLLSMIPGVHPPGARRPRWNTWVGAVVAFAGILLLTAPPAASSVIPDFASINAGDVITFGCSVGFALHCIALAHVSPRVSFQPLALLQIGFCALFMLVSLPFIERPHVTWTPNLVIALVVAAVLATAAAFSIQSWAQAVLPSTHIALILTLEPVFAWITSFLVLHERLGMRAASGAVLILAAIALTELVPQPHLSSAHEA
jgi:drug/metabolite transporter (DMT)-like permease